MTPIVWKPAFSVGDPAVDHEHRKLIDLVNRTAAAILDRHPAADIERGFGDLLQAISAHFALEERQMREAGYDRLAEHKADHERLLDTLRALMDEAGEAPASAADRLVPTLEDWFVVHFRVHDSRLHRRLGPRPPP
jgi:hemerythrin-like metal-binding protein